MITKLLQTIIEEKILIKNSIAVLTSTALGGILGAVTTILLSRIFTPHDFGILKTLTSFYGFFIYFLDFGFQNTLIKYTSQYEAQKKEDKLRHLIQNLFLFRTAILIFIVSASLIFKREIASAFLNNKDLSYLIYPSIIFSIITFLDLTRPIIIGLQNFRLLSTINIMVPLSGLFILVPSALYLGLPFTIIALGLTHFIGSLISLIFLIKKKYHLKPKNSLLKWPRLVFSYGLPSYFSALPSYIFLAIIPLLSLFFNQTKIGYYSFSLSFYTLAMIVPVGITQILFPKIAALSIKNEIKALQTLKNITFLYTFVAVLEITVLLLFTKITVKLLSPNFLPATNLIITLVSTAVILGYLTLAISYFTAKHKLKLAFILNIIITSIFVIVSFTATNFFL